MGRIASTSSAWFVFSLTLALIAPQAGTINTPAAAPPMLGGCPLFPANNVWNTRIDHLPVDARSGSYISSIGAGTGLLFILRWFWWRINALSELAAMIVSFAVAVYFEFFCHADVADWKRLVVGVAVTTVSWTLVTLVTRPTDEATLRRFCRLIKPGGPGWRTVVQQARAAGDDVESSEEKWSVPIGIIAMVLGCASVYSALFAAGYWIYREWLPATVLTCLAVFCGAALTALWSRVNAS